MCGGKSAARVRRNAPGEKSADSGERKVEHEDVRGLAFERDPFDDRTHGSGVGEVPAADVDDVALFDEDGELADTVLGVQVNS